VKSQEGEITLKYMEEQFANCHDRTAAKNKKAVTKQAEPNK
jgi:hypothetical protein